MAEKILRSNTFWEVLALGVVLAALVVWCVSVLPFDGWRWSEPPGQGFYLVSKLFGLLAVIAIWWQILAAIMTHPSVSRQRLRGHRQTGVLLMVFALVHYLLFVVAVYLRNQTFPYDLLYPVFDNYFKLSLSAGWFAFTSLCIVFVSATFRRHLEKVWKYAHRLAYVTVVFGMLHGFMIGSETGYGLFFYIYLSLALTLAVALITRVAFSKHTLIARAS